MTQKGRTRNLFALLPAFCIVLAFCMVSALLPVTATAATPGEVNQRFTVTNSGNVFTVTRSGDASAAETVRYRTVSLSALERENFTAASGTLTFEAGETSKTVSVTERTAAGMFRYAAGSGSSGYRQYRFEVLDANGFLLASRLRGFEVTRVLTQATSGNYDLGNERYGTFYSSKVGPLCITDAGYNKNPLDNFTPFDTQKYLSLPSTTFYDASTQAYLAENRAELRMTLGFYASEAYDGYQYVQVLTDNTSTCDSGAGSGDPGTIRLSRYMAGFEIMKDAPYTEFFKKFTFPVLSVGNNQGHTDPWGYGTDFPLSKQKFNPTARATDGKIVLNTDFNTLVLRFDASGSDKDNWRINDINAYVTAVDETAPAAYNNYITVSPGPYNAGNDFYVSVPFTEIVIGNPTLLTSWGEAYYIDGSGSNVLTFEGTVPADTGTPLSVTGFSGTLPKDLFENILGSSAAAKDFNIRASNPAYAVSYVLAGGSVAAANPSSYTWDTAAFTLSNPTREGYTFAGWTGSNGDTPETAVTVPTHSHGSRTYIANWTPIDYTVSITGGIEHGSVTSDKTAGLHVGDAVTLTVTSEDGYEPVSLTVNGEDVTGNISGGEYTFTMPASNVTVSATFISEWAALQGRLNAGGTVTLTKDVAALPSDSYLVIPAGVTVTLDLNGHTLSRGLTTETNYGFVIKVEGTMTLIDSSNSGTGVVTGGLSSGSNGGGVTVNSGGSFTLSGGIITGNTAPYGGGVNVNSGGSFTMTGGLISGNTANYFGGGVNLSGSSTFTMTGGTIESNNASLGGGVAAGSNSTFRISGSPVVTGNTENSKISNVRLDTGKTIAVTGLLTDGASVGVTLPNGTGVFTSGLSGNGTAANFTGDNSRYDVYLFNGEATLIRQCTVILDPGEDGGEPVVYRSSEQTGFPDWRNAQNCQFFLEDDGRMGFRLDPEYCPDSFIAPEGYTFKKWNMSGIVLLSGTETTFTALWQSGADLPVSVEILGDASKIGYTLWAKEDGLDSEPSFEEQGAVRITNGMIPAGWVLGLEVTSNGDLSVTDDIFDGVYQTDGFILSEGQTVGRTTFRDPEGPIKVTLTVDAVWLALDPNGGESYVEYKVIPRGVPTAIPQNPFTRAGYAFTGWNTQADGNGTAYADGASITAYGDVTLYAQWAETDYVLLDAASLLLLDKIGVNFYTILTDTLKNDAGAYALFDGPNGLKKVLVSEATLKDDGRVVFTYDVYAKQTREDITIRFFDGSDAGINLYLNDPSHTAVGAEGFTYSVNDYLAAIEASEESTEMKDLAAAIADYGAATDRLFAYSGENAPSVEEDLSGITADSLAQYRLIESGTAPEGFSLLGASLLAESETTLRVYFAFPDVSALSVTINGTAATVEQKGSSYYVSVLGIKAKELGKSVVIRFGDYEIECSALTYAYSVLRAYENDPSEDAQILCTFARALARYQSTAVAYFESR